MFNQYIHNDTNRTRPARTAKVTEVGPKYTLETKDGTTIKAVGGFGKFQYPVDTFVTYIQRGDEYFIVQAAPHGF